MGRYSIATRLIVVGLVTFLPRIGFAQAEAEPVLTPPRLAHAPAVPRPPGVASEDEVAVELMLEVEADGSVATSELVQPRGDALDQAALDASRDLRFDPALRDGVPMRARIRFRLVFAPPVPAETPAADVVPQASGDDVVPPPDVAVSAEDEDESYALGVRARVDPPARDLTRYTLPREVLTRIPGNRGDPLRAIEILPGVGRPLFGLGLVIVRGSAPTDSQVMIDGMPTPLLYHFGGLTSVVPGRMIDRIDFYPGTFGARYGRSTGGIVEVTTRTPATDRFHGAVELGVVDTSAFIEGPITERLSIALSLRRSIIDALMAPVASSFGPGFRAPTYYDYQLMLAYRPTSRDELRFRVLGSSDALRVYDDDGGFQTSTQFHYVGASFTRTANAERSHSLSLQVGPTMLRASIGQDLSMRAQGIRIFGRTEHSFTIAEGLRLMVGADVPSGPIRYTFDFG